MSPKILVKLKKYRLIEKVEALNPYVNNKINFNYYKKNVSHYIYDNDDNNIYGDYNDGYNNNYVYDSNDGYQKFLL